MDVRQSRQVESPSVWHLHKFYTQRVAHATVTVGLHHMKPQAKSESTSNGSLPDFSRGGPQPAGSLRVALVAAATAAAEVTAEGIPVPSALPMLLALMPRPAAAAGGGNASPATECACATIRGDPGAGMWPCRADARSPSALAAAPPAANAAAPAEAAADELSNGPASRPASSSRWSPRLEAAAELRKPVRDCDCKCDA